VARVSKQKSCLTIVKSRRDVSFVASISKNHKHGSLDFATGGLGALQHGQITAEFMQFMRGIRRPVRLKLATT
jgi:hypothetical protein